MGRFIDILVNNLLKYAIHWPIAMFKSQFINRRKRSREKKTMNEFSSQLFVHCRSVCSFHGGIKIK